MTFACSASDADIRVTLNGLLTGQRAAQLRDGAPPAAAALRRGARAISVDADQALGARALATPRQRKVSGGCLRAARDSVVTEWNCDCRSLPTFSH